MYVYLILAAGIVLVAINPYQYLPLYGSEFIRLYSQHHQGEMEPHVFSVACEAHHSMTR